MLKKNHIKTLNILSTEDYNRLVGELKIKDSKYKTYPERRKYKMNSLKRISEVLAMSDYPLTGLVDKDLQQKGFFSFMITNAFIVLRRSNKFLTLNFVCLNYYLHHYIVNQWSFERGIYKEALYGNTKRSNELRLLLNFYFPEHHYSKIFNELIENFRYCEEHGI